ncbi:MAG: sigma-70 family RNA polymerase sigma factor [Deltaproteobacteria bacterium]|nr:sigma-70 family RNA polymerase sigma factor [Deltaproteobacteria bacterium]
MALPVMSDSIQSYLAEINRFPLLSPEEEREVAERYYRLRGLEDAHILVTSNLRFVVKIALEYRNYGCRLADLIQEGNIGLMVAVKKFNPMKGCRLITYAALWIRSTMQEFILRTKGMVRRNTKALKRRLFYRNEGGRDADAGAVDLANDVSLDATLADDKTRHLDMLRDDRPGPFSAVEAREDALRHERDVSSALAVLNPKERLVIEKRLMADEPASLQRLGDELGLTRERVRQIEGVAMKKLRSLLGRKDAASLRPEPA